MPIPPSPLERYFTTHPGPHRHSLAATAVQAPAWEALRAHLPADWAFPLGYGEPTGDPGLRGLVAAEHGVTPERVLLTHGAADANFLALAAIVRPGDRVVCQQPIYPQLPCVLAMLGAEVVPWTLPAEGPADLAALADLMGPATRLLVINSPHNPTGRVFAPEALAEMARLVEAQPAGYWLVDEVYRGVGSVPLPPSAIRLSDRALVTGSVSKAWALPGPRVGWLVGPAEVVEAALPWREHTTLALSSASEALVAALWPKRQAIMAEVQAIAARNRGLVRAWLAEHPALAGAPSDHAGCFLLTPPGPFDDMSACDRWYDEDRVLVIPGSTVGYPGTLRVGFGQRDAEALVAALQDLAARLAPA